MAYTITSQCIACDRCRSVCPTNAVKRDGTSFWIDINLCNNCVNAYSVPQCWASCPTDTGCMSFMSGVTAVASQKPSSQTEQHSADYWESWFTTYDRMVSRLRTAKRSEYWQQWFDAYAKVLSKQLQTQTNTDNVSAH
ncbi:MAG TPA: 4Fe-4S dicluster domain-containing protein [Crinalium sp.]